MSPRRCMNNDFCTCKKKRKKTTIADEQLHKVDLYQRRRMKTTSSSCQCQCDYEPSNYLSSFTFLALFIAEEKCALRLFFIFYFLNENCPTHYKYKTKQ